MKDYRKMLLLRGIVTYFVFGVISKYMVEGLQCYVCDDCNEYEDFKELHICGEINTATTMKPVTLPEIPENPNNGTISTVKPVPEDTDEYIYDDSVETHDEANVSSSSHNNSIQLNERTHTKTVIATTANPTTIVKTPATASTTSGKPLQINGDDDYLEYDLTNNGEDSNLEQAIKTETTKTEKPTTSTNKSTVKETTTHATMTVSSSSSSSSIQTKPSVSSQQTDDGDDYFEYDQINSETNPAIINKPEAVENDNTTTNSTPVPSVSSSATPDSSTTNSLPIEPTDEDDYLEYDVDNSDENRSVQKNSKSAHISLLKINEPVCYMIKFSVNNTVITNRGCTTFLNANSYLTCQSLYNGAPMNACRVCSSDGCNKFLSNDGSDEDHDFIFDAAGIPKKFNILVLLLFAIICSAVV